MSLGLFDLLLRAFVHLDDGVEVIFLLLSRRLHRVLLVDDFLQLVAGDLGHDFGLGA